MPYVKVSPTVTAGAYARHDCVGTKMTLEGVTRIDGAEAMLMTFVVIDQAMQEAPLAVFLFDSDPAAGTYTNDSACDIHDTDADKMIGAFYVDVEDYVTVADNSIATVGNLGIFCRPLTGTSLYAVVKTLGTPTFAAATDVQFIFGFRRLN